MFFLKLRNGAGFIGLGMVLIVLYLVSRSNFLFFHTISEAYIIIVSILIFAISWNTRDTVSEFFMLLGVTFLSVGIIRAFHLMTSEGMTVFINSNHNVSTQFWITSRYLENLGIISAILFCKKNINYGMMVLFSVAVSLTLVVFILHFQLFSACCIQDSCTSSFKLISEYIIIATNLLAAGLLYIKRDFISSGLLKLLSASLVISAVSGIFFSLKNGSENLYFPGYILDMVSFYFIYKAVLVTGIQEPFNTLLYHLKNNELELRRSRDDLETKVLKRTEDLDFLNKNLQLEIEARKMKERELKKSEERMSLLLKSSRISITHFDRNLKPLPLFHNDKDPITSQHNFYRLSLLPGWQQLDKMMRTVIQNQKSIRDDIEFKISRESMFFDVVIEPSFDENNEISGVFVIALDISEKKKIESVLKKKHQAIESIYTIATSFSYQKENIYEKICQSIATILEVPVVSIGKILNNKLCGYDRYKNDKYEHSDTSVDCALCKIMLSAKTACQISGNMKELYPETLCLTTGGIKTYLGVPVLSRTGEVTGIICVLDLKERKFSADQIQLLEIFARYISNEIEKEMFVKELVQSREMALLGKLTSGVAHEVRNPLNAIWAITEALFLDLERDETNLVYKEHIHSQVQRLSRLMQDLLDLGKPHVRNDRFSFSNLCKETIRLWSQNDASKTHNILFIADENEKFMIQGDSTKMQQVLMNLFDNASEHSPAASNIIVGITIPESGFLCLKVSDEGSGISSELMNRIFDPFFTTRKGGTGLGLSIVKHIVENHNGTISLNNNNPPPGITVKILLPLAGDSNQHKSDTDLSAGSQEIPHREETVS